MQLYCTAPQGRLGKPSKVLCAFAKTRTLAHGESQTLTLKAPWRNFASYDDSGVTGHKSAFVLEAGEYRFSLGTDVRSAEEAFTVTLPLMVVEQLESAAAPAVAFERLRPGADGTPAWEPVPTEEERPEPRRAARLRGNGSRLATKASACGMWPMVPLRWQTLWHSSAMRSFAPLSGAMG